MSHRQRLIHPIWVLSGAAVTVILVSAGYTQAPQRQPPRGAIEAQSASRPQLSCPEQQKTDHDRSPLFDPDAPEPVSPNRT